MEGEEEKEVTSSVEGKRFSEPPQPEEEEEEEDGVDIRDSIHGPNWNEGKILIDIPLNSICQNDSTPNK